jgi:hypothetical protein
MQLGNPQKHKGQHLSEQICHIPTLTFLKPTFQWHHRHENKMIAQALTIWKTTSCQHETQQMQLNDPQKHVVRHLSKQI